MNREEQREKAKKFMEAIVVLSKEYGFSIAHEDFNGGTSTFD